MATATAKRETQAPELIPASEVKNDLINFNVTDAVIAKWEEEFLTLKVSGPTDEKGYEAVHAARMTIKAKRVEVDKLRVEMNAEALAHQRKVNAEAKRITGKLTPIEDHLEKQEKVVTEEKERQRKAAEEAERLRLEAEEKARKEADAAEFRRQNEELERQRREIAERREREDAELAERQRIENERMAEERAKIEAEKKLLFHLASGRA